jgi:inner membrane protein
MDNLTHSLVGLAAAKAGLERLSPGATAVCILAANAPDADILAVLGGKWFYLHHHRGITHSIVGTLALAFLIPVLFYTVDSLIARLRKRQPRVRFKGLLLASFLMCASHPLMDWTNNYGVRPFLPWSGEWFYGDLVFVIDPWLWLLVGGAAFLLTSQRKWQMALWGLLALAVTGMMLYVRLESYGVLYPNVIRALWIAGIVSLAVARWKNLGQFAGSRVAIVALSLVFVYWGAMAVIHRKAISDARTIVQELSAQRGETVMRFAAMPVLADPLRWLCVAETDRATYRFLLSITGDNREAASTASRYEKPQGREAEILARAARDERAQIFLNFARFPAAQVEGDCLSETLVQLADLRYTEPGSQRSGTFHLELPVECEPVSVDSTKQ